MGASRRVKRLIVMVNGKDSVYADALSRTLRRVELAGPPGERRRPEIKHSKGASRFVERIGMGAPQFGEVLIVMGASQVVRLLVVIGRLAVREVADRDGHLAVCEAADRYGRLAVCEAADRHGRLAVCEAADRHGQRQSRCAVTRRTPGR